MLIKATSEAIELWKSINDATAKDLIEDDTFFLMEHRVYPEEVRIAGIGAILGGQGIGFADKGTDDGGKWLGWKYWVNGNLGETFTFVCFKNLSH
jgi:hypothetical protein